MRINKNNLLRPDRILMLLALCYIIVQITIMTSFKAVLFWLPVTLLAAYMFNTTIAFILQSKILFSPAKNLCIDPKKIDIPIEEVRFTTSDGVSLYGWYAAKNNADITVIYCYGHSMNVSWYLDRMQMYYESDVNCLLFDYRGYGRSQGKPSECGTYQDVLAAYKWLTKEKGISPNRIVVHGWSLGGAIAAWLAGSNPVAGLILDSTFTSATDIAKQSHPAFLVHLFYRYKYNTAAYLKKANCPVLVIHSTEDMINPYKMGEKLFDIASEPKQFIKTSNPHVDEGEEEWDNSFEQPLIAWVKALNCLPHK